MAAVAGIGWWAWRRAPDRRAGVPSGGALLATIRSEPRTFNRYVASDTTSDLVSLLAHAKLVRINRATQELEPWLAERWSTSPDGLVHTLTLRPGVTFSDGAPFTSADVVFAFQAIYDDKTGSPLGSALRVADRPLEVSAPDASTVVVKFPAPFGPGLQLLDGLPILPRHRLEGALRAGTLRNAWGLTTLPADMAGLGPFVIAEYRPGQRLVFERNRRYWRRAASGAALPYLDRLTLEIVPDQAAEALRLESGEVDLMQSEIRAQDYAAFKRAADAGRLGLHDLGVGLDADALWFNLNEDSKASDPRRAWLQDDVLRRAISLAVDRQALADAVFFGAAVPAHGPITPGSRHWYSADAPRDGHDPGKARALLDSIGLQDRDGDGRREDGLGQPARFSLLTQKGNTTRERAAAFIQEELKTIGLVVDIVALEQGALIDRWQRRDYDAMYFGTLTSNPDPALNLEYWLSSGGFHFWNPGQASPATEWERRIDELIHRQSATLDQAERKRLFDEAQRVFAEHVPAVYLVAPRVIVAMGSRVANAMPALQRPQVLWNADTLAVLPSAPPRR